MKRYFFLLCLPCLATAADWCEPTVARTAALVNSICSTATTIPDRFTKPYELPPVLISSLFKILEQQQVAHETLDSVFDDSALRTRQLLNQAELFKSDDPAALRFKASAREALLSGDIAQSVTLLTRAAEREQVAASKLPVFSVKYQQQAAKTRAALGELARIRLLPAGAASHFQAAADLLPNNTPELTAEYLGYAGAALFDAGQLEAAETLLQRSLEILRQQDNPELSRALNNLAGLYFARQLYHQAKPLYEELLDNDEAKFGREHVDLVVTLDRLAKIYHLEGDKEQARVFYERVLSLEEQHLGSQHPDVAITLARLARLYAETNKRVKAIEFYQQSLSIDEKNLGKDHPALANLLNELAGLYKSNKQADKAQQLYERALTLELPPRARSTLLNNLAVLHENNGRFDEAIKLYAEAIAREEAHLGKSDPALATLLNNLASLHQSRGNHAQAKTLYERALGILKTAYGEWYPGYQAILANYQSLPE